MSKFSSIRVDELSETNVGIVAQPNIFFPLVDHYEITASLIQDGPAVSTITQNGTGSVVTIGGEFNTLTPGTTYWISLAYFDNGVEVDRTGLWAITQAAGTVSLTGLPPGNYCGEEWDDDDVGPSGGDQDGVFVPLKDGRSSGGYWRPTVRG